MEPKASRHVTRKYDKLRGWEAFITNKGEVLEGAVEEGFTFHCVGDRKGPTQFIGGFQRLTER